MHANSCQQQHSRQPKKVREYSDQKTAVNTVGRPGIVRDYHRIQSSRSKGMTFSLTVKPCSNKCLLLLEVCSLILLGLAAAQQNRPIVVLDNSKVRPRNTGIAPTSSSEGTILGVGIIFRTGSEAMYLRSVMVALSQIGSPPGLDFHLYSTWNSPGGFLPLAILQSTSPSLSLTTTATYYTFGVGEIANVQLQSNTVYAFVLLPKSGATTSNGVTIATADGAVPTGTATFDSMVLRSSLGVWTRDNTEGIMLLQLIAPAAGTCTAGQVGCDPTSCDASGSCQLCPAGTFIPPGGTTCQLCPAGSFSDTDGASQCTVCPAGTFSTNGATTCSACPLGQYTSEPNSISCQPSPPGTQPTADNTGFELCQPGTYSPGGLETCTNCPRGTKFSEIGAQSVSECQVCPTGQMSAEGASLCCDISLLPCRRACCPIGNTCSSAGECLICPEATPVACPHSCCPTGNTCAADGTCLPPCAALYAASVTGTCSSTGTGIEGSNRRHSCTFPDPSMQCEPGQTFNLYSPCRCQDGNTALMCGDLQLCLAEVANMQANGDPHFTGYDGSTFDFKGSENDVYNLVTAANYQVNALFGTIRHMNGTDNGLWLMAIGIQYVNISITVRIKLGDGYQPYVWRDPESHHATHMRMKIPKHYPWIHIQMEGHDITTELYSGAPFPVERPDMVLYFPNNKQHHPHDPYDGPIMVIKTPDLELTVYVETEDVIHLDVRTKLLSTNVTEMHGVLGQTLHWDKPTPKEIVGKDEDYIVKDGLLGTNFKYNLFKVDKPLTDNRRRLSTLHDPVGRQCGTKVEEKIPFIVIPGM